MKVILGIDPGLAFTGYGVIAVDGSSYRHLGHGVIGTSPQEDMGSRLVRLHLGLEEVLEAYRPQESSVELIYFAKNSKTAIPVAQARGVVLYTLAARGIPIAEYTPLQLKQALIGRGRAEKRQIQEMLKILFRLESVPAPDHAADALALAVCHANISSVRRRISALGG